MGILGFMVDWGIGVLNNFKYFNAINVIVTTRAQQLQCCVCSQNLITSTPRHLTPSMWAAGGFWAPFATYTSISLGYALVAACLVSYVEPLAAGSGIAEVKTYLNGIHIKGLLTVSQLSGPLTAFT